jgi:hypothetical protein
MYIMENSFGSGRISGLPIRSQLLKKEEKSPDPIPALQCAMVGVAPMVVKFLKQR